jgi:6-phosphogluconate dehydrogenase
MGQQFGVIGLAVMGENIALNIERNGFPIAVYNRTGAKTDAFMSGRAAGKNVVPAYDLPSFVKALDRPRKILIMVKAGAGTDAVIDQIKPLLDEGDILIDGGNSYYKDTERRILSLEGTGIRYFGMGISGGEEGALKGPSIMPGGNPEAYKDMEPILQKISAQTDTGPCVSYMGTRSAGHFVKMCHNGIEYGDMQLIAEVYDILRNGLELSSAEIEEIFTDWNQGELQSYLIEITKNIVNFQDDLGGDQVLVDCILDSAGQKGTGKWTTMAALELGVPVPTITASVDGRLISAIKEERVNASKVYSSPSLQQKPNKEEAVNNIRAALYASKICSYAQGFALMRAASEEYQYGLNYGEIARIWKGGCIIRAIFLDRIREAFNEQSDLPNLLMAPSFRKDMEQRIDAWRWTVKLAIDMGIAVPAMSVSLGYFDSYRRERLPANLIQAQRDYFGAHTFERIDTDGVFHTEWYEIDE